MALDLNHALIHGFPLSGQLYQSQLSGLSLTIHQFSSAHG